MRSEWFDNIFGDGWRDPSEDVNRLAVYILASIGGALGLVASGYGLYEIWAQTTPLAIALTLLLTGPILAHVCLKFLKREARKWDIRDLDAEAVVTGGFLCGFAFIFIGALGVELGAIGIFLMTLCMATGGAILALSLVGGFICAYWHKLPFAKMVLRGVLIEERYALDEMGQKLLNHPAPHEEGHTACVRIRTAKGEYLELTCTRDVYARVKPGHRGLARLIKYRVMEFEPGG